MLVLTERQKDEALLRRARNDQGNLKYSEEHIQSLTEEFFKSAVRGEKIQILSRLLKKNDPSLSENDSINQAIKLLDESENPDPNDPKPPQPTEEEGAGKALPPEDNFPAVATNISEQMNEMLQKQIRETIPPLVPVASLSEFDLFLDPIKRQMFVLVVAKPTGFFYVGINVPCLYPIVVPPFFPVTSVGKSPAGLIALAFADPTVDYCTNSKPFDEKLFEVTGEFSAEGDPDIQPCEPNLSFQEYSRCNDSLHQLMRKKLGKMPVTPELKYILDLIRTIPVYPAPNEVVPTEKIGPEIEIFTEDPFEETDFELDIIE